MRSMTAFINHVIKKDWGIAYWDIRSFNKRFLDIKIKLPEIFKKIEPFIYKFIKSNLFRGRVECFLYFYPENFTNHSIIINKKYTNNLIKILKYIKKISNEGIINPIEILSWPGVIKNKNKNYDLVIKDLLSEFEKSLLKFIIIREKEGKNLKKIIKLKLNCLKNEIKNINKQIPINLKLYRKHLLNKIKQEKICLSSERIEQELLFIIQKIDITEELDRLYIHIKEINKILKKKYPIGRRLDFILQELNRESNTISSKSIDIKIISYSIKLKILIEQIREQVQNIE